MSTGGVEQIQLLKVHKEDPYDGVIVHMDEPMDPEVFAAALRASVSEWRQKGKKGVWIKLPKNVSNLVDPAVKEGFWYHHAEPDYVMLVYWIPTDSPSTLPVNASHRVGVGAFVMNSKREVLVVQEKSGKFRGTGVWKLPTGVVNEGEDICTAVIREVQEETGLETEFVEILAFRQSHKSFFSKSDLFFVCMLQPKSSHIEKQLVEIEEVQWMPIDAYAEQDFVKKNQQFDIIAKFEQKGTGPGARSSHAITIVGHKVYAFGGEFAPRVPVDNQLYVFDLRELTWYVASAIGDVRPPRMGVTMAAVGTTIYVFGGRDATHKELNELYSFDTDTSRWTLLSTGEAGPAHRSYHSMISDDRWVYVFGGCGVAGRLNDLWAFDVVDQKWAQYPSPGENCKGRGGPGLAVVGRKIWIVYGFAGKEVDDVHCYDPTSGHWAQVETVGDKPSLRSVFSSVGIGKYIYIHGGEVDPSDLGHMGAGKFSGEGYVLDTETLTWTRLENGSS